MRTTSLYHSLFHVPAGQLEAGAKLASNHDAVVGDALKNAGLLREGCSEADAEYVRGVVELTVRVRTQLCGGENEGACILLEPCTYMVCGITSVMMYVASH